MRRPSRSVSAVCGASSGTAACSVQRANPSSASVTTSASASTTRFAPVIPRSTTPSWTYSGTSCARTSRRSTGRVRARDEQRPVGRLEAEAGVGAEPSAGSAIRPFEGTARVSRPFVPARTKPFAAILAALSLSMTFGRARSGSRRSRAAATGRLASPSRCSSARARRSRRTGRAAPAASRSATGA